MDGYRGKKPREEPRQGRGKYGALTRGLRKKKSKRSEPFWILSGLIMDGDVDEKGSGGSGRISPLGAG